MSNLTKQIPKHLIYEMVDGQPIYYKGYKDFLTGTNKTDEPMVSSLLQSIIISNLVHLLHQKIGTTHLVLTNELGLQFSKGSWRAADIAIYKKTQINIAEVSNKYSNIPPKIVIEIDTKAEIEDIKDTFTYYNKKTDELLAFGVEKVIWIFSDTEKVLIAPQNKDWALVSWEKNIEVLPDVFIQVTNLVSL